jgi:hypothetical protein
MYRARFQYLNLTYDYLNLTYDDDEPVSIFSLNFNLRRSRLARLTALEELDLFGAKITDAGAALLRHMPLLRSLELCGGGITDVGVRHLAAGELVRGVRAFRGAHAFNGAWVCNSSK